MQAGAPPGSRGGRGEGRGGWRWRAVAGTCAAVVIAGLLSSCSAGAVDGKSGAVDVVTSTNVWGDVAAAIGGRWVNVHAIISDPDQDPHSYTASARTLLEIKDADLLVENGGGYDDFMGQMVDASGTSAPVLDAVTISGLRAPAGGELNEHVWYDVPTVEKVADALAAKLGALAPKHAQEFSANAAAFDAKAAKLVAAETRVKEHQAGTGVAVTEPVPDYLLNQMGLRNLTPPDFSNSVEASGDVAPRVLVDTLDLFSRHEVALLVYNEQTSGPVTEQVKSAAEHAGIPVVGVTETMPAGSTYLSWMSRNIDQVKEALLQR